MLLLLLSLFFFTNSCAGQTTISSGHTHAIPFPTHDNLNVKKSLSQATQIPPLPKTQEEFKDESRNKSSWKLNLLHRDELPFSNFTDLGRRFQSRMRRDARRAAHLIGAKYEAEELGAEVVSGLGWDLGIAEYVVRIGVGTPPQYQYLEIDTGSNLMWVQCQPCKPCFPQYDPVFDPTRSSSFAIVPCSSTICNRIHLGCTRGRCSYGIVYIDGSYNMGTMVQETITFGGTVVRDVTMGCSQTNQGMVTGAGGLLGLAGGSMTFMAQIPGQTGGVFSYCLASWHAESSGSLEFGREIIPVGAVWVPLLRSIRAPTTYYIGLSGLGVGNIKLPISEDVFRLTEQGNGGVIMDIGTSVTRLPKVAYETLRYIYMTQIATIPRAPSFSQLDTCYDLNGLGTVQVPTISFFFTGGQIWTLAAKNILIPVNKRGIFCFAFAPSPTGISIIGNLQQQGIQITIDNSNGFVGFGPNNC
ncbi:PREDICTED: protein ASPARTIC PROTEASE IN GUARD CELL 2-like [Ipomoea nil]|uniref:protein ASPARTIC PROTEASE IN GUARD CELL 2-like n=1 Tax=Ipomoea nil TaxID=35883 RepID=UPI000900F97F|nr:PREDICTED: protein ASPARTIC PROTEASE IN GUARD CELL 2-like [Ipomoea nil]